MDPQPIRKPIILRIPIRPKKPTPPPPAAASNAAARKLRESLLGKLAAASVPLSPALRSQIDQRLRELAPTFHTPDHPPYALMIRKAIEELGDQLGSTENSISEFIVRAYKDLPVAHKLMLTHYLGKLCGDGEIVHVDGDRFMLPGNEKKEKKVSRRKGKRRRGSRNVGNDENRCQVENFKLCVGGEIEGNGGAEEERRGQMGKGKMVPRRRRPRAMQVVERVEGRQAMEVAEQSRAMVVYVKGSRGNELSVQVVENGSQAQRQGVQMLTESLETQDDLVNLLDWNPVPSRIFQLDNSELVGQAEAEGTSCAIELKKKKQEMAEKLSCQHPSPSPSPSPSFAIEVKQLKEEITKMKQDMQDLASENQKVHVDVELLTLKKMYNDLLEKTKKVGEQLMGISVSGAEVENVVEEASGTQEHSNGWTEIAKSLPVTTATSEILEETAITSLDTTLYLEYTEHDQQPQLPQPPDLSSSTSLDSASMPATMELSQEEQQAKLCVADEVEQEQQLEFPNSENPVELERMTENPVEQGGGQSKSGPTTVTSILESLPMQHQPQQQPQEHPNSKKPHKKISRTMTHSLPPAERKVDTLQLQTGAARTIVAGLAHTNRNPSEQRKGSMGRKRLPRVKVDASNLNYSRCKHNEQQIEK